MPAAMQHANADIASYAINLGDVRKDGLRLTHSTPRADKRAGIHKQKTMRFSLQTTF